MNYSIEEAREKLMLIDMPNFDCKKMHSKCKALCCSIVPIPKRIWDRNSDKIVENPLQIFEEEGVNLASFPENEMIVTPLTLSGNCPFLNEDLSCNIYDDRPHVCKKFGDESCVNMSCPYQARDGRVRSRQERRHIERNVEKRRMDLLEGKFNEDQFR